MCPAFPNGIPDRIAYGTDRHFEVQPDQVGDVTYAHVFRTSRYESPDYPGSVYLTPPREVP